MRFSGACTLTHSTNLVLPGAVNWTTAAGDILTFRCIAAGQWFLTGASNVASNPTLAGYARLDGTNQPFTGAVNITTGVMASGRPFQVSGDFTSVAQSVDFTNSNTSSTAYQALTLKAGSSTVGTTLTDAAPEYTTLAQFTGRGVLENSGNGVGLSALGGSGTIDFFTGASRTLRGRVTSAGVLDWTGAINAGGALACANGASFGSVVAPGGATDLSRHIALFGTSSGLSVTTGVVNLVAAGQVFAFSSAGAFTAPGAVSDNKGNVRAVP